MIRINKKKHGCVGFTQLWQGGCGRKRRGWEGAGARRGPLDCRKRRGKEEELGGSGGTKEG
ncbi:hypothetical protein CK934_02330 [Chitinophaga sp. MD30]|nr:hypothetical protein CK934_02330 [Chitinophaga sp. MD30]